VRTIVLLILSNIFMTFAWYGHLKYRSEALGKVILASCGIAFFEYCFQVPANRIGSYEFTTVQLKTIQEVITLSVFSVFSVLYLGEKLKEGLRCRVWLHCSRGVLRIPQMVSAVHGIRYGAQATMSCLPEKCKSGGSPGSVRPAASATEFRRNSASAACSCHGGWWISPR
jgi:uncharacterized protein (DUF486 family)